MSTRRPTTRARADDGFARDDDEDDGAHDDVAANTIVVYTKPGCCLCDGLKDKLDAAVDAAARAHGMDGRHHHRLGRAFVVVLARICKSM